MIAFKHRFHGHGSLRFVYQKGDSVRGQLLSIKYIINNRRTTYRVAVVVSKKISKSAVVRNRIRRRLYEIVRGYETDIQRPYDIVITVFSDQLATMDSNELKTALTSQLKRSGVIS